MAQRFELPLEKDASSRFLPWIVALMTYLVSLCLTVFLLLSGGMEQWRNDLKGQLAIQILPSGIEKQDRERAEKTLALLNRTPGIDSARLLSPGEIEGLLSPWLGRDVLTVDFPAPRMIEIEATRDRLDIGALGRQLQSISKDILLDDHEGWFADILRLSRSLEILSLFIAVCVAVAAGATVVFVMRSGLAVHASAIEVLHLIGARDSYIAHQFQNHAFWLGLRGALTGFFLALATIIGLAVLAGGVRLPFASVLDINLWQWMALASVPVVAIIVTTFTTRLTVMLILARML